MIMTDPRSYNSLTDPHLQAYFENKPIRKHLQRVGLISRHGDIVPHREYESTLNRRSRCEQIRAQLSRGVVERVLELERARQAALRRQFEMVTKRMLVENVKDSRQYSRATRPSDFISLTRPKTASTITRPVFVQQIQTVPDRKRSPPRIPSAYPSRTPATTTTSPIRLKTPMTKTFNPNRCQVTMIYLGPSTMIDYDREFFDANGHQIVVMQQHCGGQNLPVFKGTIKPNETFTFESRRHAEFPFALAVYVNGLIDSRISVCCEYKHKQGMPLGGKRGSFAIQNVLGSQPCLKCRFNPVEKSFERPRTSTESTHRRTSVVPCSEVLLRTPSPQDTDEDDQSESTIPVKTSIEQTSDNETAVSVRTEVKQEQTDDAKEMYEKLSNKITGDLSWEQQAHIHHQLGNICKEGLYDIEKALEHYCTSLEIRSQYVLPLDVTLRNIYSSIGQILLSQDHQQENRTALDYFQRILAIDHAASELNHKALASDYNMIGLILRDQKHFDEALFNFKQSLKHIPLANVKQTNETNHLSVYDQKALASLPSNSPLDSAEIHLNIATTFQRLGQRQNALKHAQDAVDLCQSDHSRQESYRNYLNVLRNTH